MKNTNRKSIKDQLIRYNITDQTTQQIEGRQFFGYVFEQSLFFVTAIQKFMNETRERESMRLQNKSKGRRINANVTHWFRTHKNQSHHIIIIESNISTHKRSSLASLK